MIPVNNGIPEDGISLLYVAIKFSLVVLISLFASAKGFPAMSLGRQ